VVYPDVESLFIDDDIVLLGLLAAQAARANERREAIRQSGVLASELEDASQELATSRAQLESEARFRAALEAHPGILIVTEPDGRIGYANGQALRSLATRRRRSAGAGSTMCWCDATRPATTHGRSPGDRPGASARRIHVPGRVRGQQLRGPGRARVARGDHGRHGPDRERAICGARSSGSSRTSCGRRSRPIYGGSQVLLSRGDRLDSDVANDLLTDIAAEAERLHRLIENLLVLARVERGEDIAGGEPVLLQHVLPSIVERRARALARDRHHGDDPAGLCRPSAATTRT
jgi:hypothetical protein